MEVAGANERPSTSLPSISMLDANRSDAIAGGPSYGSRTPPYSRPDHSASGIPAGPPSPPGSRRASGDDKDRRPPPRQSLPSIHEALRGEPPGGYPVQPPAPPTYFQSSQSGRQSPGLRSTMHSEPHHPPPSSLPPAHGLANGYSQRSSSPFAQRAEAIPPPPSHVSARPEQQHIGQSVATPKLPSLHPLRTGSPVEAPRYSYPPQQQAPAYDPPPPPPQPVQHPPSHISYAPSYQQQQHQPYSSAPPPTSVPPPHLAFDSRPTHPSATSAPYAPPSYTTHPNPADLHRLEESKRLGAGRPSAAPAYGESVKRHLENFDYEASLNEIADANAHLLEFSNTYRRLAHQSLPRGGPGLVAGVSVPGMAEIEEMMRKSTQMHQALLRVKDLIVEQSVNSAEQQQQQQLAAAQQQQQQQDEQQQHQHHRYGSTGSGPPNGYGARQVDEHHAAGYPGDVDAKGAAAGVGYAGGDPKKPRRGRAAPPGRCHSCNRAETPEWRRGPDGARTLCNACGLHYAKLTRKMGTNNKGGQPQSQGQPLGGSNLRPKGPDSPTL